MADLMKSAHPASRRPAPDPAPGAEAALTTPAVHDASGGPEDPDGRVPDAEPGQGDDRTGGPAGSGTVPLAGGAGTGPARSRASALARRRRGVLAVACAAALLSLGGLGGAMLVKSPAQVAADTGAPKAAVITAPVTSQRLARTVVLRGDVTSGATLSITPATVADTRALGGGTNPGGSTPILTRRPAHVGDTVGAARPLVEFSGRPVYVLPGRIPVYRDMLPGESGDDIAQLQSALSGLGLYSGGDARGRFGTATEKAVVALYRRMGYPVPVTPGAGTGDSERSGSGSVAGGAAAGRAFVPSSEMAFAPSVPVRVVGLPAAVGDKVSGPVVSLATGGLRLTGYLDPSYAGLVEEGMKIRISAETLGVSAAGTVASVGALVTPGDKAGAASDDPAAPPASGAPANGGVPYLPVQVTREGTWDNRLDGQNVRMTITAAATAGAVLTVPEAAINSGADARTSVTVLRPDGSRHTVRVTVGVSADGMVQVAPAGSGRLGGGDLVVVGQ